jgi:hypothetical protein
MDRKRLEADAILQWVTHGLLTEAEAAEQVKRLSDAELLEWFEESE